VSLSAAEAMDEVANGVGQWVASDPLTTRRQGGETHALYTCLKHTASPDQLRPGACVLVRYVAARAVSPMQPLRPLQPPRRDEYK
jgi:hypothetical protein